MAEEPTFILKWKKTWPNERDDRKDDFTGRDPANGKMFARIYRQVATSDPDKTWFWTVSTDERRIASGTTADARSAARAAEAAYEARTKTKSG